MNGTRLILLTAAAFLLALGPMIVACGDDGGTQASPPVVSPDLPPEVGGIEALHGYLRVTGVDGRRGILADPIDCDDRADGDFCIKSDKAASIYAPGLVKVFLANVDSQDEDIWQVSITRTEAGWQVTLVDALPK